MRHPGLTNVNSLSSTIFPVIQAGTTGSERCWFETGRAQGTKDRNESKRHSHACTQATKKRKLAVQISILSLRTGHVGASRLVIELLPLECLSILRQEETGLLDQERSQNRENTCCGTRRDTHASSFAKQDTLSRRRLDNQADHRTFTCSTQPKQKTKKNIYNQILLVCERHHDEEAEEGQHHQKEEEEGQAAPPHKERENAAPRQTRGRETAPPKGGAGREVAPLERREEGKAAPPKGARRSSTNQKGRGKSSTTQDGKAAAN